MLHPDQAKIQSFRVVPALPEPLAPLLEIAHNLWWTWRPEASTLFSRLDPDLWTETQHNPVKLLGLVGQDRLDLAAEDRGYVHALRAVVEHLRGDLERPAWFDRHAAALGDAANLRIAYFSAEFGLTECFQIYSGGLGCLAGDHLKSASELGLPLVGVGLLYRNGYFHQYLNADGWQQETYVDIDAPNQPVHRVIDPDAGRPLEISVQMDGRDVAVGVWRCNVGRIPLYLLDTNMQENVREDRDITRNLYGGDVETRIRQEIVLGVGGVRALTALGIEPTVYHMNEGHSAFLSLEHVRMIRERHDVSFDEAREAASAAHVFTTHTPVPAGIDRFSPDLVARYFEPMLDDIGLDMNGLMALGRERPDNHDEFFSMALLALRMSKFANGVSRLHGEVSRNMWRHAWPGVPVPEIPIGHITNGVHARSWVGPAMMRLFDRYLGWNWQEDAADHDVWADVAEIPDEELWQAHQREREWLVSWCRGRIRSQLQRRGAGPEEVEVACGALDPDIFTIGFARRFATYKRANLVLRDVERLRAMLNNEDRPVQIIIAGKAHPADGPGKDMIRNIVKFAEAGGHSNRVVFVEDYDIDVARRLVRGCDIWLNTPRRGMEASGTSGMKAAMNGVINVSVLDGWWDEAYESEIGFAIGRGETYDDPELQDTIESRATFDLLERQILPEFYQRDATGYPRKWIARMKRCIATIGPAFNTNRMVAEYADRYYLPSHRAAASLQSGSLKEARALARQLKRLHAHWREIVVVGAESDIGSSVPLRGEVPVRARVRLGSLRPDEVRVQLYHGEVDSLGDMVKATPVDMIHQRDEGGGEHSFAGSFLVEESGRRGFSVRVLPRDERLVHHFVPGLITWHGQPAPAKTDAPAHEPAVAGA